MVGSALVGASVCYPGGCAWQGRLGVPGTAQADPPPREGERMGHRVGRNGVPLSSGLALVERATKLPSVIPERKGRVCPSGGPAARARESAGRVTHPISPGAASPSLTGIAGRTGTLV